MENLNFLIVLFALHYSVYWILSASLIYTINTLCFISKGSHSKSHSPSNSFIDDQINTKHLLLPGRSAFVKHLVREVAYFEICEFLIGQIEEIYDMENCEFLDSVYGEKNKDKSLQIPTDFQVKLSFCISK